MSPWDWPPERLKPQPAAPACPTGSRIGPPRGGGPRQVHESKKKKESADKPGSVWGNHSSAIRVTAYLKRPTRESVWATHAIQSKVLAEDGTARSPIWSCSGRGLPCHRVLPPARCALTAPFHPYRPHPNPPPLAGEGRVGGRRFTFCCTFRGLAPPRRYLAPCPGSPDFPPRLRAAVVWPTPGAHGADALLNKQALPQLAK